MNPKSEQLLVSVVLIGLAVMVITGGRPGRPAIERPEK